MINLPPAEVEVRAYRQRAEEYYVDVEALGKSWAQPIPEGDGVVIIVGTRIGDVKLISALHPWTTDALIEPIHAMAYALGRAEVEIPPDLDAASRREDFSLTDLDAFDAVLQRRRERVGEYVSAIEPKLRAAWAQLHEQEETA